MKKLLVLVMACIMVCGTAVASFAGTGPIAGWENEKLTSSTDVHAVVEPYAGACWDGVPYIEFEGAALEQRGGSAGLTYAYNTPVDLSFKATALQLVGGTDVISTQYTVGGGAPVVVVDGVNQIAIGTATSPSGSARGTAHIVVGIKGTLGEIYDQAAGNYQSTITVTVTSPLAKPSYDID